MKRILSALVIFLLNFSIFPQEAQKTGSFEKNNSVASNFNVGDIGPGGGIIFYIKNQNVWECSKVIGKKNWDDAKNLCKNYRAGGFDDWYLPSKDELNYIYRNLKKIEKISREGCFWSSLELNESYSWVQSFCAGSKSVSCKDNVYFVRAVRKFSY